MFVSRRGQNCATEKASQYVHLEQDLPEVPCLRLVRRCLGSRIWVHPDGSAKATDKRFEVEVPSAAILDMSSFSAGTFVSILIVAPAENSSQTMRAEAFVAG